MLSNLAHPGAERVNGSPLDWTYKGHNIALTGVPTRRGVKIYTVIERDGSRHSFEFRSFQQALSGACEAVDAGAA